MCPYKREVEGNLTKGEGEVIMKTKVGMITATRQGMPRWSLEVEKDKEQMISWSLKKESALLIP